MALLSFFQWCSNWQAVVIVRESKYGMPAVQSVHLIGLTVFLATILLLNLRLARLGMLHVPLADLSQNLKPWMRGALSLSILSGIFIFMATPGKYLGSNPFRLKMLLLVIAVLFHFSILRRFVRSKPGSHSPRANLVVACLSVTSWFCVGWAGRAIAFIP